MRATELAIGVFILIATVTLVNSTVAPLLGFDLVTGGQTDIERTNEDLTGDVDGGVTEGGSLSPLAALDILTTGISILSNLTGFLMNLGVPVYIANWVTSPIALVMALAMVTVVLRTQL
ncbi:hypothetical protein [Halomarina oriensis]|uniref:Uncharacterized protein n=1 Tax=Halomarina oriensis TaxID=671145 RepID=A0A6B0GI78_9EURY|nr:hypothetical protein [Halomarina oriensis]MWG33139.1 hypothetical protein [Halomarina oriensis]